MSVRAGEAYRFFQEVWFDGHRHGVTGGGECQITRGSDGLTWDGAAFTAGDHWNATMVSAGGHYYDWTVPAAANDGDVFTMRIRLADDPDTEGGGTMVVREAGEGGPGGDVFIYPITVFDD